MNIKLFLNKIYWAIVKKSNAQNNKKSYATWSEKGYNPTPEISFIIQSHNKSLQVKHIVGKLRECRDAEIIVIDDGSERQHTQSLAKFLNRANEFLIRSGDLYEVIMYDKAIRFCNGRYICLLQDDDDFDTLEWVEQALGCFRKYPLLAILGGNNGQQVTLLPGGEMMLQSVTDTDKPFVPAMYVDRAPMWIARSHYMERLKHIDQSFAPFQFDDCELCLRAWLSGLWAGWYPAHFKSLSAGGMRIWNSAFTGEQCQRNGIKLYQRYASEQEAIEKMVKKATDELNEQRT